MSAETTLQKVLSVLGLSAEANIESANNTVEVELAQKKTQDGQATFDSENFAVGESVNIVTADGMVPVPEGTYMLEDGSQIVVDDNSVIQQVMTETEQEEQKEQAMEEPMQEEEMGYGNKKEMGQPKKTIQSTVVETQYSEQLKELETKLSAIEKENQELKERMKFEESPRTTHSPERGNEPTKLKFKIGAKRQETIQDRVFNQLFS